MYTFEKHQQINWTSHVALVVMNPLEDPLEKGMVTHSSILAWRILWAEEPGRLQSMGSQEKRNIKLVSWTLTEQM